MSDHSFSSAIFQREIGFAPTLSFPLTPFVPYSTLPNSFSSIPVFPFNSTSSEKIWLEGKENLLVSLNASGQVVCYNLLNSSKRMILTTCHERALKAFFAGEFLFVAVKTGLDDSVQFFLIAVKDLQNCSPVRTQILKELVVGVKDLKEFNVKDCKLVVESQNSVQIWDILNEDLWKSFPLHPQIAYQYTNGWFVFWETLKTETKFGVFSLNDNKFMKFSIQTEQKVYFCHILNKALVLGIKNCSLQMINLETFESIVVPNRVPKILNDFNKSDNFFTVFQDGFCMLNFDCNRLVKIKGEVIVCEIGEFLYFWQANGKFGRIREGTVEDLGVVYGVEQIGGNWDTGQVFLACQSEIFVFG